MIKGLSGSCIGYTASFVVWDYWRYGKESPTDKKIQFWMKQHQIRFEKPSFRVETRGGETYKVGWAKFHSHAETDTYLPAYVLVRFKKKGIEVEGPSQDQADYGLDPAMIKELERYCVKSMQALQALSIPSLLVGVTPSSVKIMERYQ